MINLDAIRARVAATPGTCRADCTGQPTVTYGYGEAFVNWLPNTDLYLRRRKGELPKDEMRRLYDVARRLDREVLAGAYQAHADVAALVDEVERLRTLAQIARRFRAVLAAAMGAREIEALDVALAAYDAKGGE